MKRLDLSWTAHIDDFSTGILYFVWKWLVIKSHIFLCVKLADNNGTNKIFISLFYMKPLSLGLLRSDLMLESICAGECSCPRSYCCWKQVEINTIASGFGHLGPISKEIQRSSNWKTKIFSTKFYSFLIFCFNFLKLVTSYLCHLHSFKIVKIQNFFKFLECFLKFFFQNECFFDYTILVGIYETWNYGGQKFEFF